jgi:hypothetical protein
MTERQLAALAIPLTVVCLVACCLGAFVHGAWFALALAAGVPIGPLTATHYWP